MDIEQLLKQAPSLPSYQGHYQAIQLEPITQSNERISVLILATSKTDFKIINTLTPEIITCMFGDSAGQISNIINLTQESISEHLANNGKFDDWQPPFSGIYKSKSHQTLSTDIEGILFQGLTSYSSLYQGNIVTDRIDKFLNITKEENSDKINQRLITSVKQEILKTNPLFKNRFDNKIKLTKGSAVNIDYAGEKYNAALSDFTIKHKKNASDKAKAKLFELDVLRQDRQNSTVQTPQQFELLIHTSHNNNQEADLLQSITEQADTLELIVRGLKDSKEIASHILKSEAA